MNNEDLKKIKIKYPNADLFENLANSIGGEIKTLYNDIQNFLQIADQSQDVSLEKPILLFSDQFEFRACCGNLTNFGEIVISKEVFFLFYKISYTFMRNKRFMPHIGDSEKEESFRLDIQSINLNSDDWGFDVLKPKCPTRLMYAHYLFKFIILHIIGHEFAHLRRGHFSVSDSNNIDTIRPDGTTQRISVFEVRELDADAVSVDLISFFARYINQQLDSSHIASWIFNSYENINNLILTSLKFATLIFSVDKKWTLDPYGTHYPPSIARDLNIFAQAILTLTNLFNEKDKKNV